VIVVEKSDALFLDFDGTLAPLQDDPATVFLEDSLHHVIELIALRLSGAVALISGRDLRDLAARTRNSVWRIGNHGLEVAPPRTTISPIEDHPPIHIQESLVNFAEQHEGLILEGKGRILAMHYRQAPEFEALAIETVEKLVALTPGYVVQVGHKVVEAKPAEANKGQALKKLMSQKPFLNRRPIMVGDDKTDEDAFSAALASGGAAIKVGAGVTVATERLPDPAAVHAWLKENASR